MVFGQNLMHQSNRGINISSSTSRQEDYISGCDWSGKVKHYIVGRVEKQVLSGVFEKWNIPPVPHIVMH